MKEKETLTSSCNEKIREISSQSAADNEAAKLNKLKYESLLSQEQEIVQKNIRENTEKIELRLRKEYDTKLEKNIRALELKYETKQVIAANSARFCLIWSILQAIGNKWIKRDILDVIDQIKKIIIYCFHLLIGYGDVVGKYGNLINNRSASEAINGLLHLLTWIVLFFMFYILPAVIIGKLLLVLVDTAKYDDSLWIVSVSTSSFVVWACLLQEDPIANLLVVWAFLEIIIIGLRHICR